MIELGTRSSVPCVEILWELATLRGNWAVVFGAVMILCVDMGRYRWIKSLLEKLLTLRKG